MLGVPFVPPQGPDLKIDCSKVDISPIGQTPASGSLSNRVQATSELFPGRTVDLHWESRNEGQVDVVFP